MGRDQYGGQMLETLVKSRRILALLLLLALSLVAAGVMQMVFVFQADQALEHLVQTDLRELRRVQGVTESTAEAHRYMLNTLFTDRKEEVQNMLDKSSLAALEVERLLEKPDVADKFQAQQTRFRAAWKEYRAAQEETFAAFRSGRNVEAQRLRREVVRPCYEKVRLELKAWAQEVEQGAKSYAEDTRSDLRLRHMTLLLFCAWPLAVALLAVLILGVCWAWALNRLPDDSGLLSKD